MPAAQALGQDVVVIDDATRRFGDATALDGVSLSVPQGAILGLIGPSGSGKTTTVRLLTGALSPTSGEVRVLGEDPVRFKRRTRERIGYMPQSFTLYPDLTARENVDFVASLFGMLWPRRRRRTREVLELVELWEVRRRRASALSGGMQRRLELAGALVHDPALLFLDEPTAGIDPLLRSRIWDELHRLRDAGRTLLVTTQYVNEAEACDRVALISDGHLIALAEPDALRRQAFGGDIVEIETTGPVDRSLVTGLPFVRRVDLVGTSSLRVSVDDAATAMPDMVEALGRGGVEVSSARDSRPSFDEVFALLVERDRAERVPSEADQVAGSAA
jgi:ABC-2 type transport system ATP-binding protein